MPVLYANRAFSTLAANITNSATSLSVASGHGARFPAISGGDYFYATLDNNAGSVEIVKVTARSTDTFTIVRAQDGTSALAFSAGAGVELRVVKAMIDDIKTDARSGLEASLGFTPVQQGGGTGQGANKLYVGWLGSQLGLQVDVTNFGATWPIGISGNAATVTNGVYTTGDQSIGGNKTFTGQIAVPAGTSAAPSIRFSDDTDTGIFRSGTNTLAITTGGTTAATFDANGNLEVIGRLRSSGNQSVAAWTTTGQSFDTAAATFTDTSTAAAGTVATRVLNSFNTPTLASTNAITVTTAATVYIANRPTAGTNTTITTGYALWVDNGNCQFDGDATVNGTLNVRAALDLADNDILRLGSSDDWEFFHNGTDNYIDLNVGNLIIRDNTTEQFRFERTTGNLGIGTSSPNQKLEVRGTIRAGLQSSSISGTVLLDDSYSGTDSLVSINTVRSTGGLLLGAGVMQQENSANIVSTTGINIHRSALYLESGAFVFKNAAAAAVARGTAVTLNTLMTLDASGNVGIGISSPSARVHINASTDGGGLIVGHINQTASQVNIGIGYRTAGRPFVGTNANSNPLEIGTRSNVHIAFVTNDIERAQITGSNGWLLVGSTSESHAYSSFSMRWVGYLMLSRNTTADTNQIVFFNPNGQIGAINSNGSATAYVTSSDYRLKTNVEPMTGALARVAALKPVTFTWKADGAAGEGFIAHELQEVCPQAVTGQKDAVDEAGKPRHQGVDTSFLVATLTAAIQEQQALIATLTARVAALEAN